MINEEVAMAGNNIQLIQTIKVKHLSHAD